MSEFVAKFSFALRARRLGGTLVGLAGAFYLLSRERKHGDDANTAATVLHHQKAIQMQSWQIEKGVVKLAVTLKQNL